MEILLNIIIIHFNKLNYLKYLLLNFLIIINFVNLSFILIINTIHIIKIN